MVYMVEKDQLNAASVEVVGGCGKQATECQRWRSAIGVVVDFVQLAGVGWGLSWGDRLVCVRSGCPGYK